ncbi:MAG: ABC transporter substrate-binding protein [Actinomycetota bacterium]
MIRRTFVLVLAVAFVAGCAGSEPPVSTTGSSSDHTQAPTTTAIEQETNSPDGVFYTGIDGVVSDVSDPSRVISLAGDITEIIFELGAGDSIVATDITTVYPEAAVLLPKVGIGRFLSPEAVLKHNPTIVIGDSVTAPLSAIDQLRAAGVPVVILDLSTSFDTLYSKVRDLGFILGADEAAAGLEADLHSAISAASVDRESTGLTAAYVYTRGPDVMLLLGDGMVSHPVIEAGGAVDAGALIGVEGSIPVTPEALIAAAPDVLIVPTEGLEALGGIDGLLAMPGVAETPAGLSGWILSYPEGDFLTIGPRIVAVIEALATDLSGFAGSS